MSMQKTLLPLFSAFVLTAMVAGEAKADGMAATSAKFNCGTASVDGDVVQGVYATSINTHNPQQQTTVQFSKTFVDAFERVPGNLRNLQQPMIVSLPNRPSSSTVR
jgi:hypothetical protein